MTLQAAAKILADINDAALREAAHNLAVERGMARVEAMRSGPGTAPPPAKPAPAYVAPTPAPAPTAPPPKGWNANKPSSMRALDAARRQREGR